MNAALAATDGATRFLSGELGGRRDNRTSRKRDCESVEIKTISLAGLMHRYGLQQIELLKLDIEGAESRASGESA